MLKDNDVKLLEELFVSNYFSYMNIKNFKINNCDINLKKLHLETVDLLYDGMDTVLEVLDICGADK